MHGDNGGVVRKQYNPDHFPIWVATLYASIFATIGLGIGALFMDLPVWLAITIGLCLIGGVVVAYVILFSGREAPPIQPTISVPSFDLATSSGWSYRLPGGQWVRFDPETRLAWSTDGSRSFTQDALIAEVQRLADLFAGKDFYRVEVVR